MATYMCRLKYKTIYNIDIKTKGTEVWLDGWSLERDRTGCCSVWNEEECYTVMDWGTFVMLIGNTSTSMYQNGMGVGVVTNAVNALI